MKPFNEYPIINKKLWKSMCYFYRNTQPNSVEEFIEDSIDNKYYTLHGIWFEIEIDLNYFDFEKITSLKEGIHILTKSDYE